MSVGLFLDTDVNECDTSPCSQECANVYGSYQCYCRQGFQLAEDGHSCKGKDAALSSQVRYVYRIIESLRLEKTSKIIKSNRDPNTTMPASTVSPV